MTGLCLHIRRVPVGILFANTVSLRIQKSIVFIWACSRTQASQLSLVSSSQAQMNLTQNSSHLPPHFVKPWSGSKKQAMFFISFMSLFPSRKQSTSKGLINEVCYRRQSAWPNHGSLLCLIRVSKSPPTGHGAFRGICRSLGNYFTVVWKIDLSIYPSIILMAIFVGFIIADTITRFVANNSL